ncbi:MAG: MAPEG family protein [Rhizomicrobium sp.]
MSQAAIFTPMGVLAFWTMGVLLLAPFRRFRAAADDSGLPVADRVVMNLLELPVLFYVVCLMFFATGSVTPLAAQLAWAYAIFRLAQTIVHVTYNNSIHRVTMFAISNFVLAALWILFFFPLLTK